ncbi:MAG TPA: hypothetical protein VFP95_02010, partial [Gammaproteobacteria bacterium]|nr:hypothetical protein [Gammaproteobacteria bacterium]
MSQLQSTIDSAAESLSASQTPLDETPVEPSLAKRRLPFPFAKRHGVLVLESKGDQAAKLIWRSGGSMQSLLEVQRNLGGDLQTETVDAEEFDRLLQQAYEEQTNSAMQMMEGFEEDTSLESVA